MRPVLYGTALPSRPRLPGLPGPIAGGAKSDPWDRSLPDAGRFCPPGGGRPPGVGRACISVWPMLKVLLAVAIGLVVAQAGLYLTTIYLHRTLSVSYTHLTLPTIYSV